MRSEGTAAGFTRSGHRRRAGSQIPGGSIPAPARRQALLPHSLVRVLRSKEMTHLVLDHSQKVDALGCRSIGIGRKLTFTWVQIEFGAVLRRRIDKPAISGCVRIDRDGS